MLMSYYIHPTSIVDENVSIGEDTRIWHFCHIQQGASIGRGCNLGQNVYVGKDVNIGNGVKLQNNVSVYDGVELEEYVFCGPSMVFTNDLTPRSRYPKGYKGHIRTLVKHDATLGANCTIVCGHTIGEYATIAAGAVVTTDVKPHALMAGVPARQIGWVCECGQVLESKTQKCPDCDREYSLTDDQQLVIAEKRSKE